MPSLSTCPKVFGYIKNRFALANRIFLLLSISLAVWSFGYTFVYPNHDLNDPVFWFWNKFAAFGWCTYSPIALHLSFVITSYARKLKNWHYALLYAPGILALVVVLTVFSKEYHPDWALKVFANVYGVYYAICILTSLTTIGLWGFRSGSRREKKFAKAIIFFGGFTLFIGFLIQNVLHLLWPEIVPQVAQIIALIFALGAGYAIVKYKLMNISALVSDTQILSQIQDFVILTDNHLNIVQLNHRTEQLLGSDRKTLLCLSLKDIINNDEVSLLTAVNDLSKCQEVSLKTTNHEIPVKIHVSHVKDVVGDDVGYLLIGQDMRLVKRLKFEIKERLRAEEVLKELTFHDTLTGLFNRTFFEKELERIEEKCSSLGIIAIDVDGLKLINDTLGHTAGDNLILATSEVIKKSIGHQGTIFRIGGDEFAVLIEDSGQYHVLNLAKRIQEEEVAFALANADILLSFSVGTAFSKGPVSGKRLFKEADDSMYREKLFKLNGARNSIIRTLTQTLQTLDYFTEGHAERLQNLVERLAVSVGVPSSKINDLRLFAHFHDLGKIGIPDQVLLKPGPLTAEEKRIMQKHSEIGYRIAISSPELLPITDWVLKHHEWWNGSGYPLGLKGTDIPLECRILAIADAFDAMISNRPYRKAMSQDQALRELSLCAGIQFDPDIVDIFIRQHIEKDTPFVASFAHMVKD